MGIPRKYGIIGFNRSLYYNDWCENNSLEKIRLLRMCYKSGCAYLDYVLRDL